jgi:poly-gamma-glutamate system protein
MTDEKKRGVGLAAVALLSLALFAADRLPGPATGGAGGAAGANAASPPDPDMLKAARTMADAVDVVRGLAETAEGGLDPRTDVNRTGFIGRESSPITTSLGHLDAKRTSANPNFAAAIVRMLKEAGAGRGDAVAIGASGSFPALAVAAIIAAETVGARPLVIASFGASNWGANDPRLTLIDMLAGLRAKGVIAAAPAAIAAGGENDDGSDMAAAGRALIESRLASAAGPVVRERTLEADVRRRMEIYEAAAGGAPIKAFVNVGGSWANMGIDSRVLELKPGLAGEVAIPPEGKRGVIQAMAARGVPVIHLLFVKGLAERYGLPWDPVPLPKPGDGALFAGVAGAAGTPARGRWFPAVAVILIVACLLVVARRPIAKR